MEMCNHCVVALCEPALKFLAQGHLPGSYYTCVGSGDTFHPQHRIAEGYKKAVAKGIRAVEAALICRFEWKCMQW